MSQKVAYRFNADAKLWLELRRLDVSQAKDSKQGLVLGYSHRVNENIVLSTGYSFVEFDDNLTYLDYTMKGFFIRISALFSEDIF